MKRLFTILTIFIVAAGCGDSTVVESPSNNYLEEPGLPKPNFVNPQNKKILSITDDTLYKGDTLKINFKIPHSKDLGIKSPTDKFFFVVYSGNDTLMPSLVNWNEFKNHTYIEIITDKTKANPWDARETENKIIFNSTGVYKILLGENLESDDGTPIEIENIYYFDKTK